MSERTKIEWTDSTFNYWEGCQKAGPGCDNCYAEARNARFAGIKIEGVSVAPNWGPSAPRRLTSILNRNLPKRWNREHEAFMAAHGRRQRVFCSSLSDVFDNAVDPEWRHDLFALIVATPKLDWLLLTKRIGNVAKMVPPAWLLPGGWPAHVRIGATIVNQKEADRDLPKLLALPCPNFLSMEPLLGPVDLSEWLPIEQDRPGSPNPWRYRSKWGREPSGLHWVIVGGETGPGARPMHPDWSRSLRDQSEAAGVAFLFKQWGDWGYSDQGAITTDAKPKPGNVHVWDGAEVVAWRVEKERTGRLLDGRTWDGFPT